MVTVSAWVSPRVNTALPWGARQGADFAPDGAHVGCRASVNADSVVQYLTAHDLFVQIIQRVLHLAQAAFKPLGKVLHNLGLHLFLTLAAYFALGGIKRPYGPVVGKLAHGLLYVVAGSDEGNLAFVLADLSLDALNERDDLLNLVMRGHKSRPACPPRSPHWRSLPP